MRAAQDAQDAARAEESALEASANDILIGR